MLAASGYANNKSSHAFSQAKTTLASSLSAAREAMKISAENISIAGTEASTPGGNPGSSQVVLYKPRQHKRNKALVMQTRNIQSKQPFEEVYNPHHPGADPTTGRVKVSNTNLPLEVASMQEKKIQYEALVKMYENIRSMENMTIDMLKGTNS